MTFPFPIIPPSASVPATVTWTANAVSTTGGPPVTLSGVSIGTAAADRLVVVGIANQDNSRTLSSATIGGVSASVAVSNATGNHNLYIIQALVPTGTTADIVITWSGSVLETQIGVWAVYGANSTATATATSTANPLNASINVPAGGVLIGFARGNISPSYTWSNLTERFDTTTANGIGYTGASDAFATAQSSLSVTATQSASSTPRLALVAYGPA